MTTPKGSKTPKWKGSISRLLSCGSGKKGEDIDENQNAPLSMTSPNRVEVESEVSYDVVTTMATPGHGTDEEVEISYTEVRMIGKGTFGLVYRAKLCDTGELVAIKKVFHDERYKNRELQMMRKLDHPNILDLKYFFYSRGERYKSNEVYLNMMLDYMPETLYSVAQTDGTRSKPLMDIAFVRLYMYQVFRSLAYLHTTGICHRDVKPQNLLLNPETHVIKLCDFGSAKELITGEANIAYICSRYYRAPELVLGTTNYTSQIDVWSAGCVLGELLMGQPIFPGANGPDQLVEIIKVLGTPSVEDLYEINPNYTDMRFPQLAPHPWFKVFKETTDMDVIDLVTHLLVYAPSRRFHPIEAVAHQFFEPLRRGTIRLPDGRAPPPTLFNFTREELAINPDINSRLAPADGVDYSQYRPDPYPQDTTKLESASKPNSALGKIGGSFRSSFRGIKKVASATSSGKKKKKKKSGIEDDSDVQVVPTELNFSGGDEEHVEDGERVERVGGYSVESADVHLRPESEDLEVSTVSHDSGRRDDSIPHRYREHLKKTEDEVEEVTDRVGDVNMNDGSKKKKKKRPKAPMPLPDEDFERSIEAQMVSTSYVESETITETHHHNSTPSSGKKKKKKPKASTPTDENEARSFEESPDFEAQMTYDDTIRNFHDEPPLASDITSPGNGSQVKTKKKRPKTSKKPHDEDGNDGVHHQKPRKKVDTDL